MMMTTNATMRRRAALYALALFVAGFCGLKQAIASPTTLLQMAENSVLKQTWYLKLQHDYTHPKASAVFDPVTGAIGLNAEWEQDPGSSHYIEQQRYGADLVQAGIALGDQHLIKTGELGLEFAFDHMLSPSGVPDSAAPEHSFGLFAESAARAMLLLQASGRDPDFIRAYLPKLVSGVRWFMSSSVVQTIRSECSTFTHRCWYAAAIYAMMSDLTGDAGYDPLADDFAEQGLAQHHNGINPERGGFDVNYQMVGIVDAERYYQVAKNASLRTQTESLIADSLATEARYINSDGTINTSGSTRMGSETTLMGVPKTPEIRAFLEGLSYGALITRH